MYFATVPRWVKTPPRGLVSSKSAELHLPICRLRTPIRFTWILLLMNLGHAQHTWYKPQFLVRKLFEIEKLYVGINSLGPSDVNMRL